MPPPLPVLPPPLPTLLPSAKTVPELIVPSQFSVVAEVTPAVAPVADVKDVAQELESGTEVEALTRSFNPPAEFVASEGGPLVMIVDDSPTVRKLVSLTLERRGYRVISAFDGVAAIKELGACRPDLILLDINMPRLDGYRLCKLIKKHEATQNIPVVMLSGKDGMFDKLRGRLVGCSDYITKPFEADALTHKVAKYLTPVSSSL
jgi:twitching motility two-component system response regulator PilG